MSRKFSFACIVLLGIIACACKDSGSTQQTTEINKYIYGYTSGSVTSGSSVNVYLAETPEHTFPADQQLPGSILKITPEVKGDIFLNGNTLSFTPHQPLKNGQKYNVSLHLGALREVSKAYEYFKFSFNVIELNASLSEGNLETVRGSDSLQYVAAILTSDQMDAKELEKKVTAVWNNTSMPIEWEHNNNSHKIYIKGLYKLSQSSELVLNFDKKLFSNPILEVSIPGETEFLIMNVELGGSGEKSVKINMSDEIDPDQDLQGLISIADIPIQRYKIDGNTIFAYYTEGEDKDVLDITVHNGIRNSRGKVLEEPYAVTLALPSTNPAVRFIGKGTIIPEGGKVLIPFSAVALKAVDLQVIKVFRQNMHAFLQQNDYNDYESLKRTARAVLLKKINLQKEGEVINLNRWNDYTLNLADYIELEKGVIYRVNLRFNKSYTTLACNAESENSSSPIENWDDNDYYSEYYYGDNFSWYDREDPCTDSYYYGERFANKNIINTSLGIVAKRAANNQYYIAVSNITTAEAVENCTVVLYNLQNQRMDSVRTDKNGFAAVQPDGKAFIVMAYKDKDKAWLKVNDGSSLSLSNFDVSGQNVQSGLKGFIYGERGVWRPGDDIYLSFILENKLNIIPNGHPIIAQLTDPHGNTVQTLKSTAGDNSIHTFKFSTDADATTGYWQVSVKIGGTVFSKTLRVETIKPNRISIQMQFPNEKIIGEGIAGNKVEVKTRWLHGGSTPDKEAKTEIRLRPAQSVFKAYADYSFFNSSIDFDPYYNTLFEGETDSEGNFSFNLDKIELHNAPGILNASFTTTVSEDSGDFSISTYSTQYSPYKEYVGIKLQNSDDGWFPTKENIRFNGVVVNPEGEKVTTDSKIQIKVYRIRWSWWWDSEDGREGLYVNRSYNNLKLEKSVQAVNGAFSTTLRLEEYGRYFIEATDETSGHSSGLIAYFGSWVDSENADMATLLRITTDKKKYAPGEKIKVSIPSSKGGTAIFSIENGMSVKSIHRVATTEGETTFEIEAKQEMCPNIYVGVTLLQPQHIRDNDRPVRMYGVTGISIDAPELHLKPVIGLEKKLVPGKEFTVSVSEKDRKEMDYTIAIVDEGLLSITSFRTPNPFPAFYTKEALGVKTWDYYDYIFGAYGGRLEKAFAIGGDEAMDESETEQDERANRFTPVVLFKGPFTLKKGETQSHSFTMPDYIGEVRAMVVAAHKEGRYGSTSANALVNQDLMITASMPRLFSPEDVMELPVTAFAMSETIGQTDIQIQTDDKLEVLDGKSRSVTFNGKGEKIVWFKVRVKPNTGKTVLRFTARSGKEEANFRQEVEIRIPNPRITKINEKMLKAGESVIFTEELNGAAPQSLFEVATILPLNLGERLNYLLAYPHGCAEQITSGAFPQIALGQIMQLSPQEKQKAESNVKSVISRLSRYQTPEGGFAYWPGDSYISDWASTYVAHFLASAERQGFEVPANLSKGNLNYLNKIANNYYPNSYYNEMSQAYRLYVLALAGKPNLAAMNRLKAKKLESNAAQWTLATAYALCGHKEVAQALIEGMPIDVKAYRQTGGNFGSDLRDKAMILQALTYLDMQEEAFRLLQQISERLSSKQWLSTQDIAFSLLSATDYVNHFIGKSDDTKIRISSFGSAKEIKLEKSIYQEELKLKGQQSQVEIKNNSTVVLYARQISSYAPFGIVTDNISSGMNMSIKYYNNKGESIDITATPQGSDITAEIRVKNSGMLGTYENLALSFLLPSGFEIINDRLTGNDEAFRNADHTDIRDDRYYVYFSLKQGESKTFKFRFNATFPGEYICPAIQCSAMYDNTIEAVIAGRKININK